MKKYKTILLALMLFCTTACREKTILPTIPTYTIAFSHVVDERSLALDSVLYTNIVGNKYYINELKYFISDVCFYKNGEEYLIPYIHYVDVFYPSTLYWTINQDFNVDLEDSFYDSIAFTFGINDKKNTTNRFVNFPENAMSWPTILGGGYHYMMLNGKYIENDTLKAMNIHLGKGQIYLGNSLSTDSIVGFIDNSFRITLSLSKVLFTNQQDTLFLEMNINNWFAYPFNFDINYFGSHIMQNQVAMQMLKENGQKNVFSVKND